MVHRREARLVLALQGGLPVRLQLQSQVGDEIRCRYVVPWVFQVGAEAQAQGRDSLRGGHGASAGTELHAHHPQVCSHGLNPLDEVLQRVGHHHQGVYIGLDEAPFGLFRAQAVPLGPE